MALLLDIVNSVWRTSVHDIPRSAQFGSWTLSRRCPPHITLVFLTFTTLSLLAAPGTAGGARHRCYVCMPNDKNSSTAKDIEIHFPGQVVPDCSNFPRVIEDDYADNAMEFQFDCPLSFVGCAIRSNGIQISRICTPKPFQGCMYPNGVELCYCTHSLCNRDNATAQAKRPHQPVSREPLRTSRFYADGGVTDDEDLIPGPRPQQHRQSHHSQGHSTTTQPPHHHDEIQEGEGSGQPYDDDQSEEYDEDEDKTVKPEVMGIENNRTVDQGRRNLTFPIPSDGGDHYPDHSDPAYTHPSSGGDKNLSQDLDTPTVQGKGHIHGLSTILFSSSLLFCLVKKRHS